MSDKSLTIGGVTVSFSPIVSAINSIMTGFVNGTGAADILATIEADAKAAFTSLFGGLFPGIASEIQQIEAVLAFLKNFQPQTQEEVNAWMDRWGAGGDTAS